MRVLVTGAAGMLGYDVVRELLLRGHICCGTDIAQDRSGFDKYTESGTYSYFFADLRSTDLFKRIFEGFRPDAVVHCAAWRDAVRAEMPENKETVFEVNAVATAFIAELCLEYGSKMVYISTDYVFSGKGTKPWKTYETELCPLNVYGLSKLEGERAVMRTLSRFFIIRTAWLFGRNGKNFVDTMLTLGRTRKEIAVVDDQIGAPTYTKDLACLISEMVSSEAYGIYHAENSGGYISRYDFAKEIFRQADIDVNILPVKTADFPGDTVERPLNGRLDMSELKENGFRILPPWKDALKRYLSEMTVNG